MTIRGPLLMAVWCVFVVLIAIVAACGGSPGTAMPSQVPNGVSHGSLVVDGHEGTYRLFRPPSLDPMRPSPLVLALHGASFGGDKMAALGNWDAKAAGGGFIAAFPDWGWDASSSASADVVLVTGLIDRLENELAIDKARVFIVGASAGAEMAYRLACDLAGRIVAIASVLGAMPTSNCHPARPVSILEMHGTNDFDESYAGGVSAIQTWVTLDACVGSPLQSQSGITKTSTWNSCLDGTVVRFDTVVGGQHRWFGSTIEHDLPPVPGEPDATAVVWSFFQGLGPRA